MCTGRTYEELDIMFAKGVSARKFSTYQIDAYALESHTQNASEARDEKTD